MSVHSNCQLLLLRCLVLAVATLAGQTCAGEPIAAELTALRQAHAHNDYYHDRPLLDALSYGFCSVEADVFAIDGKLLVAHSRFELKPDRDLETLYLAPLLKRVQAHGGRVHKDGPLFTLLIDFKDDAETSYKLLKKLLHKYESMLDVRKDGVHKPGAVRIVISGNRPIETVKQEPLQLAMIDGRLPDLNAAEANPTITMISDRWTSHFRWRGDDQMAPEDLKKLRDIVRHAHEQGRVLRFWATPDRREVWQLLKQEGVDLINTDDLPGLSQYLRE